MSAATDKIANMVVGVGADPTELKSGLREGARSVDQFAEHVTVTADKMRDLLKQTGGDLQKAARLAAAAAQTDLGKVVPISSAAGYQAGKAMGESMSRGFAASNAPATSVVRSAGAAAAGCSEASAAVSAAGARQLRSLQAHSRSLALVMRSQLANRN
jgi:hypothetical protein